MKTKTLALVALLAIIPALGRAQTTRNATLTIDTGAPTGACSMGRFYMNRTNSAVYYCGPAGTWLAGFPAAAVDLSVLPDPTSIGTVASNDRIIINPVAKGGAQFDGTLTSADLTAARSWTLPNATGTLAVFLAESGHVLTINTGAFAEPFLSIPITDPGGIVGMLYTDVRCGNASNFDIRLGHYRVVCSQLSDTISCATGQDTTGRTEGTQTFSASLSYDTATADTVKVSMDGDCDASGATGTLSWRWEPMVSDGATIIP